VRDFKRHLKAVERWKPASVNLALAALDSFYTKLGLGRPVARREDLPASAPRAITVEEQRRLLRIAERATARDRAIVVVLLCTGLRLAELAGHRRLETTRRYSLPSDVDRLLAVENLQIDY
jgi:integrase